MSSPRTHIFSLSLGSQSIKLAEFRRSRSDGLVLQRFAIRELAAESSPEAGRPAQITQALREVMTEWRLRSGEVNYTLPSQPVFVRFVKLPAVEEEKVERIIAFEAEQNVPFPIDEVVWDYQLVGGGADEEIQVVLVAIKADLLEAMNTAVEASAFRTGIVDIAPMALYNAFRYNYPGQNDCCMLVDIGARTTNLLFIEPGKFFSRNISIGSGSITPRWQRNSPNHSPLRNFERSRKQS